MPDNRKQIFPVNWPSFAANTPIVTTCCVRAYAMSWKADTVCNEKN